MSKTSAQYTPGALILWEGASALDGAPIAVIATGVGKKSRNEKTGAMVQTWIIRTDIAPHLAVKTGDDVSICGGCIHRPANGGACYVKTFQAPRSVFVAYQNGRYERATGADHIADAMRGLAVRLGSYGDPAAAPLWVWEAFTRHASARTGYTHQWRAPAAQGLRPYVMASADSAQDASDARAQGWRYFRVRTGAETLGAGEFICPASKEAGYKTDCAKCHACGGLGAKAKASPVIIAHGGTARRFALSRNGTAIA